MPTKSLERLILEFNKLPGVGQKSATRYAFHILNQSEEDVKNFAEALLAVKENVKKCHICGNYCESDTCNICSDNARNHNIICVVEESKDIMILEKTTKFKGVYHVLNGRLDPLNGITPNELNIKSLLERIAKDDIEEIIEEPMDIQVIDDKSHDMKIEELDLTVRSFNCLKKAGIEEVSQLASLSLNELLKIKNLGKKSLDEILEKMKDLGYDLEKNGSPE